MPICQRIALATVRQWCRPDRWPAQEDVVVGLSKLASDGFGVAGGSDESSLCLAGPFGVNMQKHMSLSLIAHPFRCGVA